MSVELPKGYTVTLTGPQGAVVTYHELPSCLEEIAAEAYDDLRTMPLADVLQFPFRPKTEDKSA